jgi:cyanate permease
MLSATGPYVLGRVHDATNDWNKAMYVVAAITVVQLFFGLIVGKPNKVKY